jgi:hypothetical protein
MRETPALFGYVIFIIGKIFTQVTSIKENFFQIGVLTSCPSCNGVIKKQSAPRHVGGWTALAIVPGFTV